MNITVKKDGEFYSVPIAELLKNTTEEEIKVAYENLPFSEYIVRAERSSDSDFNVVIHRPQIFIRLTIESHVENNAKESFISNIERLFSDSSKYAQFSLNALNNEFRNGTEMFTYKSEKGIYFEFPVRGRNDGTLFVSPEGSKTSIEVTRDGSLSSKRTPLPNVYDSRQICWGNRNGMDSFDIKTLNEVNRIPDLYLNSIFNNDLRDSKLRDRDGLINAVITELKNRQNKSEFLTVLTECLETDSSTIYSALRNVYQLILFMNLVNLDMDFVNPYM